jgi:hypothetical protein
MSKGPPLLLLIGTFHPLVGSPPSFPIGDGLPLCSLYGFPIGKFRASLGYVFFQKNHHPHPKAPHDLLQYQLVQLPKLAMVVP